MIDLYSPKAASMSSNSIIMLENLTGMLIPM